MTAVFRDTEGQVQPLGAWFRGKPVVLWFGYARCPQLCSVVADGMVSVLRPLQASAGTDITPLLQPLRVGPLRLQNRFVMPGMQRVWCVDGAPDHRLREYYRRRALGGTALAVTDRSMVDGMLAIGKHAGVSAAPEGGAALVAIQRLVEDGSIKPQDSVVLFNTGGALKYLDVLSGQP